jgi:hypothetical protein
MERKPEAYIRDMTTSLTAALESRCDLLRSLHVPGDPLVLPNAWDVPTAKAVVASCRPFHGTHRS